LPVRSSAIQSASAGAAAASALPSSRRRLGAWQIKEILDLSLPPRAVTQEKIIKELPAGTKSADVEGCAAVCHASAGHQRLNQAPQPGERSSWLLAAFFSKPGAPARNCSRKSEGDLGFGGCRRIVSRSEVFIS
jgi:hypothetical protein